MLWKILITLGVLFALHAGFKRLLGLGLSYLATNKRFRLTVAAVSFLTVSGVRLQLHQGRVAEVHVSQLRLGRSRDVAKAAKGVWRALTTADLRLPCTVQGFTVHLRHNAASERAVQRPMPGPAGERKPRQGSHLRHRLVNLAVRVGVAVLPSIPIRAKDCKIVYQELGLVCNIPRVDLGLSCRRVASKVDVQCKIQPTEVTVKDSDASDAESAPRIPVLSLGGVTASAVLHVTSSVAGLLCQSIEGELPHLTLTASPALLATALQIQAIPKAAKPQRASMKQQQRPFDLAGLLAFLPDEVNFQLPVIVYWAQTKAGQLQVTLGLRDSQPAASLTCPSFQATSWLARVARPDAPPPDTDALRDTGQVTEAQEGEAAAEAVSQVGQLQWDVALETSQQLDLALKDTAGRDLLQLAVAGVHGTAQTASGTGPADLVAKVDVQGIGLCMPEPSAGSRSAEASSPSLMSVEHVRLGGDITHAAPGSEDVAQLHGSLQVRSLCSAVDAKLLSSFVQLLRLLKRNTDAREEVAAQSTQPGHVMRPIELLVCVQRASFRMKLNPLESWLSVHGPIMRDLAMKSNVWGRAIKAVDAVQQTRPSWEGDHSHQSRFIMSDIVDGVLSNEYLTTCRDLKEQGPTEGSEGNALLVRVEGIDALAIVCGNDADSMANAVAFIAAVDPPTADVPLQQVVKLHVDCELSNASVFFSAASQPLVSAASAVFSGPLAIARQVTALPRQYRRTMQVGRCWQAQIDVTVKGARPQPKIYTDLHGIVEGVSGCYGPGLEPSIWQVSQAGKRMSPTDPDRSRPKVPTLPWWDMLRYLWRGHLSLDCRLLGFDLAATLDANADYRSECLHAVLESLQLSLGNGALSIQCVNLVATAALAAGITKQPAATLHILPLCELPFLAAILTPTWHLPNDRNPQHHHLFPVPVPEGIRQDPLVIVDVYRTITWDMDMEVSLQAAPPVMEASTGKRIEPKPWQYGDESSMGVIYVGDQQLAFMRGFIEMFQAPYAWLKMPNKRGTFFQRLDPKRKPIKPLPKLLAQLTVNVEAAPVSVHNYVLEAEDASCGLRLTLGRVRYSGRMLMNQPAQNRPAQMAGLSAIAAKREASRVSTKQLLTDVSARDVYLYWADETADFDDISPHGSQVIISAGSGGGTATNTRFLMRRSSSLSGALGSTPTSPNKGNVGPQRTSSDSFMEPILMAASLSVYQSNPGLMDAQSAPGQAKGAKAADAQSPLKVKVSDCRVSIDLAARNALWTAIVRMVAVGQLPRKFGKRQSEVQSATLQRRNSQVIKSGTPGKEMPDDLLKLLLKQQQEQHSAGAHSQEDDGNHTDGEGLTEGEASSDRATPLFGGDEASLSSMPDTHPGAIMAEAQQLAREARMQQDREWQQGSTTTLTVEVEHFQACLASECSLGNLLLATPGVSLTGRTLSGGDNILALDVSQMQAHMMPMDVDPDTPSYWLSIQGMDLQPTSGSPLRQVCAPFTIALRHLVSGAKGLDTRLVVPDVDLAITSRDFQAINDVIQITGLSSGPHIEKIGSDQALMRDPEDEEVDVALDAFLRARHAAMSLQAEASALREGVGIKMERVLKHSSSSRSSMGGSFSGERTARWASVEMLQLKSMEESIADAELALRAYLESLGTDPGQVPSGFGGAKGVGQRLLLRWVEQQWGSSQQALKDTRVHVRDLKTKAARDAVQQRDKRFLLEVDAVACRLLQDQNTPFLQLRIGGVLLDNERNRDKSGSSKMVVQHAQVTDHTGAISATAYTEAGAVLVPWNPDASYARDALLRVQARLGIPTPQFAIWEHMDVMVHPLGVHLTDKFGTQIWEFFFPKEDEASRRQEIWVKGLEPPKPSHVRGHSRKGSNLSVLSDGESASAAPTTAIAGGSPTLSRPASPEVSHSRNATASGPIVAHQHTSSSSGQSGRERQASKTSSARDDAAAAISAAMAGGPDSGLLDTLLKQGAGPLARLAAGHRKVILRTTFAGPVRISDFGVVLDKRVYTNLEGGWKDLFNRIKWDVAKSVAKSAVGFQKGKIKELTPVVVSEGSDSDTRGGSKNVMSWIKGIGSHGPAEMQAAGGSGASAKDRAKTLMLLGKSSQGSKKQDSFKTSLPNTRKSREDAKPSTWLPHDIATISPGPRQPGGDDPSDHARSPLGDTPKSARIERLHEGEGSHTGYSSEGSNADVTGSRPGTPVSYAQVGAETSAGLSLSDLLKQPINTRANADEWVGGGVDAAAEPGQQVQQQQSRGPGDWVSFSPPDNRMPQAASIEFLSPARRGQGAGPGLSGNPFTPIALPQQQPAANNLDSPFSTPASHVSHSGASPESRVHRPADFVPSQFVPYPLVTEQYLNEGTPSRRVKMRKEVEQSRLISCCNHITKAWSEIGPPGSSVVTLSALAYFHRYYAVKDMKNNDRLLVSIAALFLATKSEDHQLALADVIYSFWSTRFKQSKNSEYQRIKDPEFFQYIREQVLSAERSMLYALGFSLKIRHPNTTILHTWDLGKRHADPEMSEFWWRTYEDPNRLASGAWTIANDVAKGLSILMFDTRNIAMACIYRAFQRAHIDPDTVPSWDGKAFWEVNGAPGVDLALIHSILAEMSKLYEKKDEIPVQHWRTLPWAQGPVPGRPEGTHTSPSAASASTSLPSTKIQEDTEAAALQSPHQASPSGARSQVKPEPQLASPAADARTAPGQPSGQALSDRSHIAGSPYHSPSRLGKRDANGDLVSELGNDESPVKWSP
ncbi:hypothetical protein WJX73_007715 [Symbiochloris irregularis]|uniref:FMP27/BLTP2/Hobbit GFWDK motif-containing RBG unit domain-containing protein n=1 Tax=Symbiochloris irregularis TaxID=706552 RepID=A0AAW1PV05_9CHLO